MDSPSLTVDSILDKILEHHGTKGMKWGVRRAQKKAEKADANWEKKVLNNRTVIKLYNEAAAKSNQDLPGINAKYDGKNLLNPNSPLTKKYHKEITDNFNKHYQEAGRKLGTNPSGTKELDANFDVMNFRFSLEVVPVKHSELEHESKTMVLMTEVDENGLVTKIVGMKPEMMQSDINTLDFLEHFGVKGMHWGVRRARAQLAERRSEDANKHASLKRKGVNQLSDNELKAVVNRMNMEQQFNKLNPATAKKGHNFVKGLLGVTVTINTAVAFAKSPTGKALGNALAKGITAGIKLPVSSVGKTI